MITELDEGVARTCETYLRLADRFAPGLVEGLYLQGSIALGDYRPGVSDVDFVAVTGRVPDGDALRAIHADLRRRHRSPAFDGLYVGWDDLRRDPTRVAAGPAAHERRVELASRFERHLVTWHVLAQAGVPVRGPDVADLDVYTDWPSLAELTRRNLVEYWTPWLRRSARSPVGLTPWATAWGYSGWHGYGTPSPPDTSRRRPTRRPTRWTPTASGGTGWFARRCGSASVGSRRTATRGGAAPT
ncbi:hypothetical protein GCM10027615_60700 [Plantactinospora veratri]